MRNLKISGLISIFVVCLTNTVVKAEEAAIIGCITQYTQVGISPETALAECKKNTLKNCIKGFTQSKVVVKAISKSEKGYLVDLGDNHTLWLEGEPWKNKGCEVNKKAQSKLESKGRNFWGTLVYREYFRQAWCSEEEISLERNYSLKEATTLCRIGYEATK